MLGISDFIKYLRSDTVTTANLLQNILTSFHSYFSSDFCNYVVPDYVSKKWVFVYSLPENPPFWTSDKINICEQLAVDPEGSGICNKALKAKRREIVPDVTAELKYVRVFEEVQHEIVIPIIHNVSGKVLACIVLDYKGRANYSEAVSLLNAMESLESAMGSYISEQVYTPAWEHFSSVKRDIARRGGIDFDNGKDIDDLRNDLGMLWPKLEYFSVFASTNDVAFALDEYRERQFVRIGSFFIDDENNTNWKQCDTEHDFIFNELQTVNGDLLTYASMLKKGLDKAMITGKDTDLIQRDRVSWSTHVALNQQWKTLLYSHPSGERKNGFDLHFVPIVESVEGRQNRGSVKHNYQQSTEIPIISFIFIYFFEDFGDPNIVDQQKLETLSRLIYSRIRFGRFKKMRDLRTDMHKLSMLVLSNIDDFVITAGKRILASFPSLYLMVILKKTYGLRKYIISSQDESYESKDIDISAYDNTINACVGAQNFHNGAMIKFSANGTICNDLSEGGNQCVPRSCLIANAVNPETHEVLGTLCLVNRLNSYLDGQVLASFSWLELLSFEHVVVDFGVFLSMHRMIENVRSTRAILSHEYITPVLLLQGKVNNIKTTVEKILPNLDKSHDLWKKFDDTSLSSSAIIDNAENIILYHNYINDPHKKINIKKTLFNIKDLFWRIMLLNKERFAVNANKIHIVMSGEGHFAYGDEKIIFSCLHNIFKNAYKYSRRFSVFDITWNEEASRTVLKFVNYGIPIHKKDLDTVFQMWYRTEDARKVTDQAQGSHNEVSGGLGLALSKWYIETCHGGKIYFKNESEPLGQYNPFFMSILKHICDRAGIRTEDVSQIRQYELPPDVLCHVQSSEYQKIVEDVIAMQVRYLSYMSDESKVKRLITGVSCLLEQAREATYRTTLIVEIPRDA